MKEVLYIGQFTAGTTSRMRAEILEELLDAPIQIIDIHKPFFQANNIFRSLGFRYKKGPLISLVNKFITKQLKPKYDLIWVDKAIFITPKTTRILRERTTKLVHFTPDTAFFDNYSNYFVKSLTYYDNIITTKSFDLANYLKLIPEEKLILATQGFNKGLHKPMHSFVDKVFGVTFIGLWEPSREKLVENLLENDILVYLAGKKWNAFVSKMNNNSLNYLGEGLFSDKYVEAISKTNFSIGLLSKKFPELHTTRTFEIPACGTALITEKNQETASFFKEDEVIFYENEKQLIEKLKYFKENLDELASITQNGMNKVIEAGFDYHSILSTLLKKVL
jgi:spore maturation protein CgeB